MSMHELRCPRCGGDILIDLAHAGAPSFACQRPHCLWAGALRLPDGLDLGADTLVAGAIDGAPVIATHLSSEYRDASHRVREQAGVIGALSMTWMGRTVVTDGAEYISLPHEEAAGYGGDMSLAEFGWLKEAISAGVIDRLVAMAPQLVDRPWPLPFSPQPAPTAGNRPAPVDPERMAFARRTGFTSACLVVQVVDRMPRADATRIIDWVERFLVLDLEAQCDLLDRLPALPTAAERPSEG